VITIANEIFDRTDVLEVVESEWIGGSGGSGVLLCHQKVGKSYLLDHLFTKTSQNPDTICCKISIDFVLATGDAVSDHAFLGELLRSLNRRIKTWIQLENVWIDDQLKSKARLGELEASSEPEAVCQRNSFRTKVALCEHKVREIETFKEVYASIAELLKRNEIRPRDIPDLLFPLRDQGKRVILFIDDYHRMIRNRAFSDALFNFLRGADQQKLLTTLVSSQFQLMHESLHSNRRERSQLFNHFQLRVLAPFTDDLALSFLDWPSASEPPLTEDEKTYLRNLGGRLPFFLRKTKDEFFRAKRPEGKPVRKEFEELLLDQFHNAFVDIWLRCSQAKRTILKGIVQGKGVNRRESDVQDLEKEGYIIFRDQEPEPFSSLFSEFIKKQPDNEVEVGPEQGIEATPILTYTVFPTAFAFVSDKEPLLDFVVRNSTEKRAQIQFIWELESYSHIGRRTVHIEPGRLAHRETFIGTPNVLKVRELTSPIRSQVRYEAHCLEPGKATLKDESVEISLLPMDYFTFARLTKQSNRLTDLTWLIAAWVRRDGSDLEKIKGEARQKHPLGVLGGYPDASKHPDAADQVREQVRAIYGALKEHGLAYDNNSLTLYKSESDFSQRVRLPHQVLEAKAANCLEGSVLFASLLLASDLDPIILFIPGHAIVGWKTHLSSSAPWEFLDTTVMMSEDFKGACNKGDSYYQPRKQICHEWEEAASSSTEPLEISDFRNFAIPVLIREVYRTRKINPLPI
jgi:hypothetical protein